MSSNLAAWMLGPKQRLEIKEAPFPIAGLNEVVVRNRAVAINPIDWVMQDQGTSFTFGWIKYPFIFGSDIAGVVVEVGSKVTRFKVGDRVVGQALSTDEKTNSAAHGGFQLYTILLEHMMAPIPDDMSYEAASVIPLGLAAAAAGLFDKDQLGLHYPEHKTVATEKTVLVWGGSTSVGCNAIQLAVAAGYDVVATSSPKNFELLKSLGATEVFDYNSPTVIRELRKAMGGRTSAGAMAIGESSTFRCLDVMKDCKGNRRIAMATFPIPSKPKRFAMLQIIYCFVTSMVSITVKSLLRGIETSFIWGSVAHSPVGDAVYVDFLPGALAKGTFKAAPEPIIVGQGLAAVQDALDMQKRGVSARKVVVSLP